MNAVFSLNKSLTDQLPCSVKVDILNLVVAPPSIDRGAETPVLGLLQRSEAVSVETCETRLSSFQHLHVLHPAVKHWDSYEGYRVNESGIIRNIMIHFDRLHICLNNTCFKYKHGIFRRKMGCLSFELLFQVMGDFKIISKEKKRNTFIYNTVSVNTACMCVSVCLCV